MQRMTEAQRRVFHTPEPVLIDDAVLARMVEATEPIDFAAVDDALDEPLVKGGQGREALDLMNVAIIAAACIIVTLLIMVAVATGGAR